MSDIVIKVENVGKQYRLGKVGTGSITSDINRWWQIARGKEDPYLKIGAVNDRTTKSSEDDVVWAIRNISFEMRRGEVLGIIGKNGAGKSTLLKILSRVTGPTVGNIKIKGRIASLLEVGTGFHPELSGRENIFLNGAILGMTKTEIKSKFDEIVDFSGVERYIDTPVKRYSSGMYVRLAFGVAAHLEPEILIVDEVLAVGDAEFQKKCLGKMKDVSGEGRTVLFVSHNVRAIESLCNSGLYLENGSPSFYSKDIREVVARYQTPAGHSELQDPNYSILKDGFRFYLPKLLNSTEDSSSTVSQHNPKVALVRVERHDSIEDLSVGICLLKQGIEIPIVQSFNVDHPSDGGFFERNKAEITYKIPMNLDHFSDGDYQIEVIAAIHNRRWILKPCDGLLSVCFSLSSSRLDGSVLFQQARRNAILMPVLDWIPQ
jgi:lipopolysaccharide transport system ATP-binding protein